MMPRFDAPNLHHSAVLFYQLTRPRGARHAARQRTAHGDAVSTHAPTRGATFCFCSRPDSQTVSTHAPARGATRRWRRCCSLRRRFNSRAREGRDPGRSPPASSSPGFNSRAREGRDAGARPRARPRLRFNSRAREGRDRLCSMRSRRRLSFNSRAREGRDSVPAPSSEPSPCFNSRAREGRDIFLPSSRHNISSFNSRAREGRDLAKARLMSLYDVSTHAPARGATCRFRFASQTA